METFAWVRLCIVHWPGSTTFLAGCPHRLLITIVLAMLLPRGPRYVTPKAEHSIVAAMTRSTLVMVFNSGMLVTP